MNEFWFESEGVRLFAKMEGQGPVMVMLHGGLADHRAVWPIVKPLVSDFRVVMPDLRGSGRSVFGQALSFRQLVSDLEALFSVLGARRAFVGGVSSGTGPALRFALSRPDLVSGLILVKPIYGGREKGYSTDQKKTLNGMDLIARRATAEGVEVLKPLYEALPAGMRERALAMVEEFDAASVVTTSRFIASGAQPFETGDELRALEMPTLLVRGDDLLHPAEVSELYESCIPNVVVEDACVDVTAAIKELCQAVPSNLGVRLTASLPQDQREQTCD